MVDFEEFDRIYPRIYAMLNIQGWISAMFTQLEATSSNALREVYHNMDEINNFQIASKVRTSKFVWKTSQIAWFLQVTKDGVDKYFDNIREQFFALVTREDLEGVVCQPVSPTRIPCMLTTLIWWLCCMVNHVIEYFATNQTYYSVILLRHVCTSWYSHGKED